MEFELVTITTPEGDEKIVIQGTDVNGVVWGIPEDESNADYQQYLADTNGGLPLSKETK